jgi:hypothetical protein
MPSACSTLRVVRPALATAVAPIASAGSALSHPSGAATGNGSSMQSLLSFTVVNTTTAKSSTATLDSPIQPGFGGLVPSAEISLKSHWFRGSIRGLNGSFCPATQMETL